MNPIALDAFLATTHDAPSPPSGKQFPLHSIPARPAAGSGQHEAVLEWVCMYQLRGQFSWTGGKSEPFKAWLHDNNVNVDLAPSSKIKYAHPGHQALMHQAP
jgi:hypothetical protein